LNVFLPANAKQGWLVISGIVSWLPIGQQFLKNFFCHSRLIPIGWRNLHIVYANGRKKMTNAEPSTLSQALAASNQVLSRVKTQLVDSIG
jgi:hypothetical protein